MEGKIAYDVLALRAFPEERVVDWLADYFQTTEGKLLFDFCSQAADAITAVQAADQAGEPLADEPITILARD
jgi:hypothetical protein